MTALPGARSGTLGAFLLLLALPAGAVTVAPISDAELCDQAQLIVEGTVLDRLPARSGEVPSTELLLVVERVIKGPDPGSTLRVRVAGGPARDGRILVLDGAPRLTPAERVLLFLTPERGGAFGVLHLGLGHFTRVEEHGTFVATRRSMPDEPEAALGGWRVVRDWEGFAGWLRARAAGSREAPRYLRLERSADDLRLRARSASDSVGGLRGRWFEFDIGRSVAWSFVRRGAPARTRKQLRRALRSWGRVSNTTVDLVLAGKTTARGALARSDGVNALISGDPDGIIPGRYDCRRGGVLAVAGWWLDGSVGEFGGLSYMAIREADIVLNEGVGCFAAGNPAGLAELLGHELGHTLGLPHSCGDRRSGSCKTVKQTESLMRAFLHDDGRGSRLNGRDRRALRRLYRHDG